MAYTPATKFPSLAYFQWSTKSAPNPRLAAPIAATDTTMRFTSAPKDRDGNLIAIGFLMGVKNNEGYTETCFVPPGALTENADGSCTAIGVVRGIRLEGLDYSTGDSSLAADHNQDAPVYCNISAVNFLLMKGALQGTIGSGANNWSIGDETDSDVTIYAHNSDTNKPFWGYDAATDQWVYSNDGISTQPFGAGSGLGGGNGIVINSGNIDVDLADTTTFKTARTTNERIGVATEASDGKISDTFLQMTDAQAATLTGGSTSDASSLHTHSQFRWGGDGSDGAVDGSANVTVTGSNNSYIVKNYSSWAAAQGGAKVLTITPTNCVLHIKIKGDADFTNWVFDFSGKGGQGGNGGTGCSGLDCIPSVGSGGGSSSFFLGMVRGGSRGSVTANRGGGGGGSGASVESDGSAGSTAPSGGGTGGAEGTTVSPAFPLAGIQRRRMIFAAPGAGGGGGSGGSSSGGVGNQSGNGGTGGNGGGCVIFEILGNVTFSSTTANFNGTNGSNGTNGISGGHGGGGGGGGAGGCLVVLYNGTLTGSLSPIINGGSGGSAGAGGHAGGAGANGPSGAYLIEKNVTFA